MLKEYKDLLISKQFFFTISNKESNQKQKEAVPEFNNGRWLPNEHYKFVEAIFLYGNEWRKVERYIKTRSAAQARSHAQKFFINIQKRFLDEHVQKLARNSSIEDNGSLDQYLIKFAINHLNCESVTKIYQNKRIDSYEYYYKDENKYKFFLNLQKLKNSYSNSTKCNFILLLKEKFVKLILNLLHSTRIHIRKLSPLKVCNENNSQLITSICSQPFYEDEEEHPKKVNPFYLSEFENEKNISTSPSNANNNELYFYDFDNIFDNSIL